jgi:hypothetical protein
VAEATPVVIRPRKLTIVAGASAVVVLALFAGLAVTLRDVYTGVNFRLADQVAMVLLGLLFAGGLLSLAASRARADADGIEVRNILRTHRLPWDAVVGVTYPEGARWARLELADDESVSVMALQAVDGASAVEAIQALRRLHERAVQ